MSRVQALLNELAKSLTEVKAPGCIPEGEPDVEFIIEVHSTWDRLAGVLYEALINSGIVGEYQGPNNEYCYLVNVSPYAASMIAVRWYGPKRHKRLVEIKRTLREFVKRSKDVYWEEITASRIRKELEIVKNEQLELASEPYKALLKFYTQRVPYRVYVQLANAPWDYDPETKTLTVTLPSDIAGHVIGKGGAKVKAFEEETGYRLRIESS
jgi:predicted RNA-binding protein YlqC (UPF0109 family)